MREGQRRRRLRAEKLAERGPLRRKVQKYFDPALAHIKQVYTPHAWSFSRLDHSRLTRLGFWALEGALAARTDVLAGCSKAENNVAHWGPVSPRTVYVPNVAEPDSVRKPTKGADEPLVLAGAGRLTAQKDPVFFAETVQAIRDAGFRVAPIWVGGGDEDVEQLFRDYGIKVTGWISHEQVQEQLKTADVYLHTARWEGFPITVLEAAANHIPVIVRRIRVFDDSGLPLVVDTPPRMWRRAGTRSWIRRPGTTCAAGPSRRCGRTAARFNETDCARSTGCTYPSWRRRRWARRRHHDD